jgi:hypothetical protein
MWSRYTRESYIYYVLCFIMSRKSNHLTSVQNNNERGSIFAPDECMMYCMSDYEHTSYIWCMSEGHAKY